MLCIVCNALPRETPVYNCPNGHILCKGCAKEEGYCTECFEDDVTGVSELAKNVLKLINEGQKKACRFGCHGIFKYEELGDHEAICPNIPSDCPSEDHQGCKFSGTMQQIRAHMLADKCIEPVKSNYFATSKDVATFYTELSSDEFGGEKHEDGTITWFPQVLQAEGFIDLMVYILVAWIPETETWVIAPMSCRSQKMCDDIHVELKLMKNYSSSDTCLVYRGPVTSKDYGLDYARQTARLIEITNLYMEAYRQAGRKTFFMVTILKPGITEEHERTSKWEKTVDSLLYDPEEEDFGPKLKIPEKRYNSDSGISSASLDADIAAAIKSLKE